MSQSFESIPIKGKCRKTFSRLLSLCPLSAAEQDTASPFCTHGAYRSRCLRHLDLFVPLFISNAAKTAIQARTIRNEQHWCRATYRGIARPQSAQVYYCPSKFTAGAKCQKNNDSRRHCYMFVTKHSVVRAV